MDFTWKDGWVWVPFILYLCIALIAWSKMAQSRRRHAVVFALIAVIGLNTGSFLASTVDWKAGYKPTAHETAATLGVVSRKQYDLSGDIKTDVVEISTRSGLVHSSRKTTTFKVRLHIHIRIDDRSSREIVILRDDVRFVPITDGWYRTISFVFDNDPSTDRFGQMVTSRQCKLAVNNGLLVNDCLIHRTIVLSEDIKKKGVESIVADRLTITTLSLTQSEIDQLFAN